MKNTTIVSIIIWILVVGLASYFFLFKKNDTALPATEVLTNEQTPVVGQVTPIDATKPVTPTATPVTNNKTTIGISVEKREIAAYHYGNGTEEILFVGGVHGGYSWNTVLLAYQLMDYLESNQNTIPANIKVTVIPVLNPDGLYKVTMAEGRFSKNDVSTSQPTLILGRFNANNVDLGRNFDCGWKSIGVWQTKPVSGGSKVFSEPESVALKNYVDDKKITAAVVWYSAAGGVYASSCNDKVSPETMKVADIYAKASGYPAYKSFDFYETTGDTVNWLASKNIPAVSVLLTTHDDPEFTKNLSGLKALLKSYTK